METTEPTKEDTCYKCNEKGHWKKDCPLNMKPGSQVPTDPPAKAGSTTSKSSKRKGPKPKNKRAFANKITTEESSIWDEVFHGFSTRIKKVTFDPGAVDTLETCDDVPEDDTIAQPTCEDPALHLYVPIDIKANAVGITLSRVMSLDTLADHSFTNNPELIMNPKQRKFKIDGVNGSGSGSIIGELPGFGDIAYTPNSNASGISISCVTSRYYVDFKQEEAFLVYVSDDFIISFDYDRSTKSYSCLFDDQLLARLKEHRSLKVEALPSP